MKLFIMNRHMEQIQKLRHSLGDYVSLADDIKRPGSVKLYLFNRRLAKLKYHESEYCRLLEEGLLAYIRAKGNK